MCLPVLPPNSTRLSLISTGLSWAVATLAKPDEQSPEYPKATALVASCMSSLGSQAQRFAELPPLQQAQGLLADDTLRMQLGMTSEQLLIQAGLLTKSDWGPLQRQSPALKLALLSPTVPFEQHTIEHVLANGGVFLYPAGVLGSALNLFFKAGDEGHIEGPLGNYVASFSSPEFGDTDEGNQGLMEGKVKGLEGINLNFFDDPRLNPVAVPSEYRTVFAQHARDVILAPVAQGLSNCFPLEMAKALKSPSPSSTSVRVLSAVKGLNEMGMTPLEYIDRMLGAVPSNEKSRKVCPIDVLGYIPVKVLMAQMAEYKKTGIWKGDPLELVLASPNHEESLEVAMRWCRVGKDPEATVTTEVRNGTTYIVIQNNHMVPPMKIVLLTDPKAIRANELASIYKNLMGLKLGRELFNETLKSVEDPNHPMHLSQLIRREITEQSAQEEERRKYFSKFYKRREKMAERDIYEAINLDLGIKNAKQLVLEEVRKDMYGSWTVTNFNQVYKLTKGAFDPALTKEQWEEGLVSFKFNIGSAFTVRNILYGVSWAADEAAINHNRSIGKFKAIEVTDKLIALGEISSKASIRIPKNGAYFFFSLIPDDLTAEGVSIAENVPRRYKKRFKDLPEGIKEASRFVQRIHRESFLGSEARANLLKISHDMSQALLPLEKFTDAMPVSTSQDTFVGFVDQLDASLEKGEAHLSSHLPAGPGSPLYDRATRGISIISGFRKNLTTIKDNLAKGGEHTHRFYADMLQHLIEIMALSNRLDIVPPAALKKETLQIGKYLQELITQTEITEEPRAVAGHSLTIQRPLIASIVMPPMTELVFSMSEKLHSPTSVIGNNYLMKILDEWKGHLEKAIPVIDAIDAFKGFLPFVTRTLEIIQDIKKSLQKGNFNPEMRAYALQAMIELVIFARRLFIVEAEDLVPTLMACGDRLEHISNYLNVRIPAESRPATPFIQFQNAA